MSTIAFADVVHQLISFSTTQPAEALILALIDSPWVQRLRDISQTANTRLVYMFSEHSRFGHCLGVAYLACTLMDKLAVHKPEEVRKFSAAVAAAALLHDIGHLAPGSHTAYKTWFPLQPDEHEAVAERVIRQDPGLSKILTQLNPRLIDDVCAILSESDSVPAWTWEIISGGGWNVDRGNWCVVDSVLSGVSYGRYNIPALTESIVLTDAGHLALRENRLDAMMHFAVSRHAMYRQIYQHRVLLAADTLNSAIAARARDIKDHLEFCDDVMRDVLSAASPADLSLETIFSMRESWWRYHLLRWSKGNDKVLADLCGRLLERRLLKTVRVAGDAEAADFRVAAEKATKDAGFDPTYYLHEISTFDLQSGDTKQSMLVLMDDGSIRQMHEADPMLNSLLKESRSSQKRWLALPAEAKALLGRHR